MLNWHVMKMTMHSPSFHQRGDPQKQKPPVLFPPSGGHGPAHAAVAVGSLAACQEVESDAGSHRARELALRPSRGWHRRAGWQSRAGNSPQVVLGHINFLWLPAGWRPS